eukprot:m51a1_g1063 putative serine-threonine protein (1278) ;mRNA; f:823975-828954
MRAAAALPSLRALALALTALAALALPAASLPSPEPSLAAPLLHRGARGAADEARWACAFQRQFTGAALAALGSGAVDPCEQPQSACSPQVPRWASCSGGSLNQITLTHVATPLQLPDLSLVPAIERLELTGCGLTGTIPDWSALSRLKQLRLGDNALTGTIPPVSGLASLEHMELSGNRLSGTIPEDISTLRTLSYLKLDNNSLTGTIPAITSDPMNTIMLSWNAFSGALPSLGGVRYLTNLYVAHAGVGGPLPPSLAALGQLQQLDLSHNAFNGTVSWSLLPASLNLLNLGGNELEGAINVSGLTRLRDLSLASNRFTGSFPAIAALRSLATLDVSNNALLGGSVTQLPAGCCTSFLLHHTAVNDSQHNLKALADNAQCVAAMSGVDCAQLLADNPDCSCDTCPGHPLHGDAVLEAGEACELHGTGCDVCTASCGTGWSSASSANCALSTVAFAAAPTCAQRGESWCATTAECFWCGAFGQCLARGAYCQNCSELPRESCSIYPCVWCDSQQACRTPASCVKCSSLDPESCANQSGCAWSYYESLCVARAAALSCAAGTRNEAGRCYGRPGCRWCATTNACDDRNGTAAALCPACAAAAGRGQCERTPSCEWCANASRCMSGGQQQCSPCTGRDSAACAADGQCAWCAARGLYQRARGEWCPRCPAAALELCTQLPGCAWCPSNASCVADSPAAAAECACGGLSQAACSGASGTCRWCASTGACVGAAMRCPVCSAYADRGACAAHGPCAWCPLEGACMARAALCLQCRFIFDAGLCARHACVWSAASASCADNATGGGGGELVASRSGDGGRRSSAALIGGVVGGVAAGLVAVAALALLAVWRARRPLRRGSRRFDGGASLSPVQGRRGAAAQELPLCATGSGELSPAEFGVHFEPAALRFESVGVGEPGEAALQIRNVGSARLLLTFGSASACPGGAKGGSGSGSGVAKWALAVSERRLALEPQAAATVAVTLTVTCTTTVRGRLLVQREGGGTTGVGVAAEVKPSLALDYDELEVREVLGRGGFGTVWRGAWRRQAVAVKEVDKALFTLGVEEDLRREVDLMCRLRSPHVIAFFGSAATEGRLCLVMELAPHGSLGAVLHGPQKPPVGPALAQRFAEDVCAGMAFLHRSGVVHRDLKSENVLVFSLAAGADVCAKICDFGTSRMVADEQLRKYTKGVGTPAYLAPEVLMGRDYGPKVDVFSYAVILLELHTRQKPYADFRSQFAMQRFVCDGGRLPIPADCPWAAAIAAAWDQDPERRPSFDDLQAMLEASRP